MTYKKHLVLICFLCVSLFYNAQSQKSDRWEATIQNFEKSDQETPPQAGAVLFTGSSSITMWKDIAEYFPESRVINRGFGGSQFSDLLQYADRVIFPYKPLKIFIYEGDNDIASGESPKAIFKEAKQLREMIEKKFPEVPVVFISAKPSVARAHLKEGYEALNKKLKKYADSKKNTMFADVYTAMLDENGEVYKHIFLEDKLHMNKEGYKIWQDVLAPYLDPKKKDWKTRVLLPFSTRIPAVPYRENFPLVSR